MAKKEKRDKSPNAETNYRRSALIDAAANLFARRGFEATTMRDIAAEVGKTPGTLYYHFKSKDDVLFAVHQRIEKRADRIFDEAQSQDMDPWQRLENASAAHLSAVLDRADYAVVIGGTLPAKGTQIRRRVVSLRDEWEAIFRSIIDDLPQETVGDKKYFRLALLGALNHCLVWFRPNRETPSEVARQIVSLLRYNLMD